MCSVRILTASPQLNAGANPDIQNYLGDTPLAFAARENYLEIVQILLAAGADPDVQNVRGGARTSETAD